MSTQVSRTLDSSNVALRLGMCAAAMAGTAATVTDANAVVITFSTPIVVPATTSGVYINLLTGATGASSALSGWDFNPYLAGTGTQLGFYWAPAVGTTARAGGVGTTAATGPYSDLAAGSTISAASTFTSGILATSASPFLTTGTHTLGFRFYNETTSVLNYGYMTMTNTASSTGFPTTITGWKFENSGGAITIPSAVPEPSTGVMLSMGALALGALNLRKLRRQRRQPARHLNA